MMKAIIIILMILFLIAGLYIAPKATWNLIVKAGKGMFSLAKIIFTESKPVIEQMVKVAKNETTTTKEK